MLSLKELIDQEFCEHNDFWNYYNQKFSFPVGNSESSKEFIREYFNAGAKLSVCEWTQMEEENQYLDQRAIHTKNVFFIGSFVQRTIDEKLSLVLHQEIYPFSYLWYLICLGHDFGYAYEDREMIIYPQESCARISSTEFKVKRFDFYRENGIQVDIPKRRVSFSKRFRARKIYYGKETCVDSLDYKIQKIIDVAQRIYRSDKIGIEFNNNTKIKLKWYTDNLIENYFKYRIERWTKMDHGIVGGDKLFYSLINNYIDEMKRNDSEGEEINFYNDRNIYFCVDLLYIYAYVSNCISAHNVYKCGDGKNDIEMYKDYKLDELLPDNYKMISYTDNPLLFVLSVADTLEPTKRFAREQEQDVLEKIKMRYNVKANEIVLCIDKQLSETEEGKSYIRNIEGLNEWCEIKCKVIIA